MPDPLDDLLGMPPLDLGETMAPQAPPPSKPSARSRAKDFAPLLALLPIVAAKGGQAGVAALLQGFSQSRQQGEATARQQQQDAEKQRQVAEAERIRRATLAQTTANNEAQRRQQFMSTFQSGLQNEALDSPEAVRAFMEFYRPQARALGMRPDAMDAITMEAMTPSRFEKKEATKVIEAAKKQYGDQAVSHTYTLKDGTQANWEELNRRSGVGLGPAVPKPNPATPGSFEEYVGLPADQQATRRRQRKEFQQADDRPQPQATVLIQTVDANGNPIQRLVPRTPGSEFAPAPNASQQTALAEQEAGLLNIGQIEATYKPEYIGPVVGRLTKAQMQIPGTPDVKPEIAEFYAAVAGLRNEIIKLMSGAAVSGAEETRMRDQLPDVIDKPSVFVAKMNQTKRNREALLQRMKARSGQPSAPPSAAPSPPPAAPVPVARVNPFRR